MKFNSLREFCKKAIFSNQLEAIELTEKEIYRIKIESRKNTGSMEISEGDRNKAYYEDLMALMRVLVNSSLRGDVRPGFLQDIHPLIIELYKTNALMGDILKEIASDGIISDTFKYAGKEIDSHPKESKQPDFLYITSSKSNVEKQDTRDIINNLDLLLNHKHKREYCERVDIGISGYESDARELCEIKEVRTWVSTIDEHFPYWFFFLSKLHRGLTFITFSLCNYKRNHDGYLHLIHDETMELYLRRHFAAMNAICDMANFSKEEKVIIANKVMLYLGLTSEDIDT